MVQPLRSCQVWLWKCIFLWNGPVYMYSTNTADFCGLCEPRINDRKDIYKNHPQVEQNQVKKHKRVSWTSVDFYKSCFNFANYPIFCGKLPISHLLRYSIACITAHRAFHMLLNMKKKMRNLLQSLPNQNENKKATQKKEAALGGWKGVPKGGNIKTGEIRIN